MLRMYIHTACQRSDLLTSVALLWRRKSDSIDGNRTTDGTQPKACIVNVFVSESVLLIFLATSF